MRLRPPTPPYIDHPGLRSAPGPSRARLDGLTRDHPVVERLDAIADDLARLVPLAGAQPAAAGPRAVDRVADRSAPVGDALDRRAARDAREDVVEDRFRILGARVVARGEGNVGAARRDLPHQRPLRPV